MRQAREQFLNMPLNDDRSAMLTAFYSVQIAYNGAHFIKQGFGNVDVWKRTFGTIAEKNKAKLRTAQGVNDFITTVQATLADMHATTSKDPAKANLDATDVESLRQAVEMLSLIDEPRG